MNTAVATESVRCLTCDFGYMSSHGCEACLWTGNRHARETLIREVWTSLREHEAIRLALQLNPKCWAGYPRIVIRDGVFARVQVHAVLSSTDVDRLRATGFVENGMRVWEYAIHGVQLSDDARADLKRAAAQETPWL